MYNIRGTSSKLPDPYNIQMSAFSDTLVSAYQTTLCHIPEGCNLNVCNCVLGFVLLEVAESVTTAVADNIHYAADNITSVVASAYSVFRQKTFEMQVNASGNCTKGERKNIRTSEY